MSRYALSIVMFACFFGSFAAAELQPGQVAILVNSKSQPSKQIAGYYAKQRGIPTNQICQIPFPTGEDALPRDTWSKSIRPAIQRWILQNKLKDKIKCFVTTYDVPLKIGPSQTPDFATQRRKRLLDLERTRRMERLLLFLQKFDEIAAAPGAAPTNAGTLTTDSSLAEVTQEISARLRSAETRIQGVQDKATQAKAINQLTQLSVATAGLQVVTTNMQRAIAAGRGNDRLEQEFHTGRGRLMGLGEAQGLLSGLPAGIERDTNAIVIIERAAGIAGTITWIENQLKELEQNETHASLDSELSLIMESNYPLLRWVPNYLHYNYDGSPIREVTRTLMVSRLEAPTLALTKSLIDKAIAVEKTGLKGKVYLDARGLTSLSAEKPPQTGTEGDYDRAILLAHKLISENTSLEVVLNNEKGLFEPNACPDVALYCGWVSLSQYVDAFKWNPGSFGYHMTSAEAQTIRKPDSQVWCKRMLDEGVAGTLGPVYEPYLLAFPRPNELFAMLLSGKFTYVECIYRTKSTNSWTMTTIGDPLYNPYKADPPLKNPPANYARVLGSLLK